MLFLMNCAANNNATAFEPGQAGIRLLVALSGVHFSRNLKLTYLQQ